MKVLGKSKNWKNKLRRAYFELIGDPSFSPGMYLENEEFDFAVRALSYNTIEEIAKSSGYTTKDRKYHSNDGWESWVPPFSFFGDSDDDPNEHEIPSSPEVIIPKDDKDLKKRGIFERAIKRIDSLLDKVESGKLPYKTYRSAIERVLAHYTKSSKKPLWWDRYEPPFIILFVILASSLFFPSITGASVYDVASTSARNGLFVFGAVLATLIAFFCLRK